MMRTKSFNVTLLACGMILPSGASASETITYTYDARGRLVAVSHSGTMNNGVQTAYTYDDADNRTNVTTTGGSSGSGGGGGASVITYRTRYVFNGRFYVSILKN